MHPSASLAVQFGIGGLAVLVVGLLIAGYAYSGPRNTKNVATAALVGCSWLALSGAIGASGLLTQWQRVPPLLVPLAGFSLIGVALLARSSVGLRMAEGLPVWVLVGFHAFRFPLELVMHSAAAEGTMPVQMTFFGGCNYDIVTGLSACLVAAMAYGGRANLTWLRAWNTMGLALLATIVCVAVLSTPTFAAFGPERLNTWVAYFPFVWMIAAHVPAALLGHLVLRRRLSALQASGSM